MLPASDICLMLSTKQQLGGVSTGYSTLSLTHAELIMRPSMNPEIFYDSNNGHSAAETTKSGRFPIIAGFADEAFQGGISMDGTILLRQYDLDSSFGAHTGVLPINMSPGLMPVMQQAGVEISTQLTTQQGVDALIQQVRVNDEDFNKSEPTLPQDGESGWRKEVRRFLSISMFSLLSWSRQSFISTCLVQIRCGLDFSADLDLQRRRAQNRAAQRAYRARKEIIIKESSARLELLQQQLTRLQSINETLSTTVSNLETEIDGLQKENTLMKRRPVSQILEWEPMSKDERNSLNWLEWSEVQA